MNLSPEFLKQADQLLGVESQQLIDAIHTPSPVSIRYNPFKNPGTFGARPVPWASNAVYLNERPIFTLDPVFHAGGYYVQEASSMFLEEVVKQHVDLNTRIVALDLCAAPGGKSTLLSTLLKKTDLLVCNEVIRPRAAILTENLQKWGTGNVVVTRNDPASFSPMENFFDLAVVDAPCSGEGMFRKDPRSVEEWSPANVKLCAERQKKILADVWPALKPGGVLIYSTCTYNLEENENNVQWAVTFLGAENPAVNFDLYPGISSALNDRVNAARFFPHKIAGEGLFIAVLRKPDGEYRPRKKELKNTLRTADKSLHNILREHTNLPGSEWLIKDNILTAVQPDITEYLNAVFSFLYPVHFGIPVGELKGKDIVPAPSLAMSLYLNKELYPVLSLEKNEALSILSKETPSLATEKEGWHLAAYNGLGLAWLKVIKNRVNNYYPKEWRIRMDFRNYEL